MFLSTILLALIIGALAGGGLPRLADLKLRWTALLVAALLLRLAAGLTREMGFADIPVGWAYIAAYGLIFAWLWGNWRVPGLQIASVGIGANMAAVLINAGQMPIWSAAFFSAGFTEADIANDPFHIVLRVDTVASFVAQGGLFGDVIPLPIPIIRDVISIGDVLLALGIFWAIVYSMTRADAPSRASLALGGSTYFRPGAAGAAALGMPYSEAGRIPAEMTEAQAEEAGIRRQSPYLQLVRNRNFSLLWTGQLISLLGDRIHVIALGALVAAAGTPLEVGLTFASTAIPSVILGPLAGVLVDRWDRRRTMIACDVVRAVLVLAVPFAFQVHIGFVYALGFAVATVTLLFRPAKTAVVPSVVGDRDLVAANSAMSVPETAADLIGFPVAGVIVTALSSVLGAAFVLDAGTYVVSAVLIWAMILPRQIDEVQEPISVRGVWRDMGEGFGFLFREKALLSNTLLSTIAQVAVGAEIVVTFLYAKDVVDLGTLSFEQMTSFLLTAIAVGSVLAGILVGALGDRAPKGPMVIAGFVGMGLSLAGAGLTRDPGLALVAFFFTGAFNMVFIIPTVTLFQERTPQRLMGRVVSSRQALVFGSIAASMGLSGYLAGLIGPAAVLVISGGICAAAGLLGIAIPSMRTAR
jgi:MFS transporter, DHA3 family, macrolide efflux protein